jgi:hypothetical protein
LRPIVRGEANDLPPGARYGMPKATLARKTLPAQ